MKVINQLPVYELNDEEVKAYESENLEVNSHLNRKDLVVIRFRDRSITVVAQDLEKALKNATNHGRF